MVEHGSDTSKLHWAARGAWCVCGRGCQEISDAARAEAAMVAAKKVHESHMAMVDARIAAIRNSAPGEYDLDDDEEPLPGEYVPGGGSSRLH